MASGYFPCCSNSFPCLRVSGASLNWISKSSPLSAGEDAVGGAFEASAEIEAEVFGLKGRAGEPDAAEGGKLSVPELAFGTLKSVEAVLPADEEIPK